MHIYTINSAGNQNKHNCDIRFQLQFRLNILGSLLKSLKERSEDENIQGDCLSNIV